MRISPLLLVLVFQPSLGYNSDLIYCSNSVLVAEEVYIKKIVSNVSVYHDDVEVLPSTYLKNENTEIFVWGESGQSKTIEEITKDVILETVYHSNGTMWISTCNGIFKYSPQDQSMTFTTIHDNITERDYKQVIETKDYIYFILEESLNTMRSIPKNGLKIDCPPQLLTGYHLAVDKMCNVYYVKTYDTSVREYKHSGSIMNPNRIPSFVASPGKDHIFIGGWDELAYIKEDNPTKDLFLTLPSCCIEWMGFDDQGNMFVSVDNQIFIFIPTQDTCIVKNEHFKYDDNKSLLTDYDNQLTNIINNINCFERNDIQMSEKILTLMMALIVIVMLMAGVYIVLHQVSYVQKKNTLRKAHITDNILIEEPVYDEIK